MDRIGDIRVKVFSNEGSPVGLGPADPASRLIPAHTKGLGHLPDPECQRGDDPDPQDLADSLEQEMPGVSVEHQVITEDDLKKVAKELDTKFYYTSAKTGENVESAFRAIGKKLI